MEKFETKIFSIFHWVYITVLRNKIEKNDIKENRSRHTSSYTYIVH